MSPIQTDFLDAVAASRPPAADIAIGHDSASLAHLANIAVRVNRGLRLDAASETILGDQEASDLLGRKYREQGHWSIPEQRTARVE
jgi:hypothetical protein